MKYSLYKDNKKIKTGLITSGRKKYVKKLFKLLDIKEIIEEIDGEFNYQEFIYCFSGNIYILNLS